MKSDSPKATPAPTWARAGWARCTTRVRCSPARSRRRPRSVSRDVPGVAFVPGLTRLALLLLLAPLCGAQELRSPAEVYGGLFEQVQLQQVFEDGKTFVDAVPVRAPEEIRADYERERKMPGFDLQAFVAKNFEPPRPAGEQAPELETARIGDVGRHIDRLWPLLTRQPDAPPPHSSLLPLPYPYVVPGGRFREIYYWDSYFTMIGLEESGRHELTRS